MSCCFGSRKSTKKNDSLPKDKHSVPLADDRAKKPLSPLETKLREVQELAPQSIVFIVSGKGEIRQALYDEQGNRKELVTSWLKYRESLEAFAASIGDRRLTKSHIRGLTHVFSAYNLGEDSILLVYRELGGQATILSPQSRQKPVLSQNDIDEKIQPILEELQRLVS